MGKGGGWERDVCKYLSKWIQGTEQPYIFWRGRGSGAMFTNSNCMVGEAFSGDVYCVKPEGAFLTDRFSIECKSGYPKASLDKHLKYNKDDCILKFWTQCYEDALKSNKLPMLIYKKKGMPVPWIGINNVSYETVASKLVNCRIVKLIWEINDCPSVNLIGMDDFFNNISPRFIIDNFWTNNTKIRTRLRLKKKV
jgi:hypothetical protein